MRKAILIALAVVAAAFVLPFVVMLASEAIDTVAGGCSEGEKRVFREFPQYGARRLEPDYSGSNGCYVAFRTEAPAEDVMTYYRQQLTARGWKLEPPPPSVEAAEGRPEAGSLSAARGRYGYQTLFETVTGGTSVVVSAIEREN